MARLNRIWRTTPSASRASASCTSLPPSPPSIVVRYESCWLAIKNGNRNQLHKEISPPLLLGAQDQRLGAEQDQLPCAQDPLLATVKRRKLARFGHVTHHDSISETILRGTLEGGRRRGRQRKCWMDNIKEWTSLPMSILPTRASCRKDWKRISADSSFVSPPTN